MKRIGLVLFSITSMMQLSAQKTLSDTIKIQQVSIESKLQEEVEVQTQTLDSTDLNAPVYKDLGESLQQNANLFVKSYGMGSMATISLRGTNASQTQLYWNGIGLNSASYGSTDLALFPTFFIDEAEVNYGLNSLQYGSGGLGGAVSLINKPTFKKQTKLSLTQDLGSFSQRNSSAKIKVGNAKWQSESKLFYRTADHNFNYTNLAKEGKPEEKVKNAHLLQKGLMQTLHYRSSEKSWLSGHFWYYDSDRNLPPLMTGTAFEEHQEDRSYRALLEYHQYFKKSKLELKSSFLQDEILYENERSSTQSESLSKSYKSLADYEFKFNQKWHWQSCLNLNFYDLRAESDFENNSRTEVSSFHEINYEPTKKWKLTAASRQLYVEEQNFWMPKLSVQFLPDSAQTWSIGGNIGQNVKYPSLNDLYLQPGGNADLEEEISQTAEVSISKKWNQNKSNLKLEAATYYSEIENYILWQPTIYGYWQARNLSSVSTQGLEARASVERQMGEVKWQLKANYTYTASIKNEKSFANDASKGKQLIYIPEHQYNLNAVLSWQEYRLSYRQQFMGARYTTTDNQEYLPYYNLSDLTLSRLFRLKKQQMLLSFSALNLFDVQYQSIQWRPMPGRNYMVRLKLMLNT